MTREPFDHDRPFTRGQMQRAGHDLPLRGKLYKKVLKGAYVSARGAKHRDVMIRAALAIHPSEAFASHLSAAALHGLPVPEDHPFQHVSVFRHEDRRFRPEVKAHVTKRTRTIGEVRGIRTTDLVTTFVQSCGWLSFVDRVVLGDALVRHHQMSAAALRKACEDSDDYYAGLARAAAALVRDGVDSPMETRLRLLIVLSGLPEPEVNVRIYNEHGELLRRYDLCYRRIKLIVEYDGRHHADNPRQWRRDIDRREQLDDEGSRILIVTSHGIYVDPADTLRRVRRQLILRGWGDVPDIKPTWIEHFAG